MLTFATKGSVLRTFHGAHSATPLEIKGAFFASGPQMVDQPGKEGGVPTWIADLFDSIPDLTQVALSGKKGGVVWTRMSPNA